MLIANYSADTSILHLALLLSLHKCCFYFSAPVKPVKLCKDLGCMMYTVVYGSSVVQTDKRLRLFKIQRWLGGFVLAKAVQGSKL